MGQSDEYAEVDGLFLDGLSEADRGRRVKADRMGKFDLVFHAGGGGGGGMRKEDWLTVRSVCCLVML